MEQRAYWDSAANTKNFATPFQDEIFARYVGKDSVILDMGCGYGRVLNELSKLGYLHLIGIDFSKGMIERGRREFPQLDLRVKEGDLIDLPDASVDAVILFAVLTCIIGNGDQERLIAEIRRVLKPNGILYVNDFLLNTDERNLERYRQYQEQYGVYGVFELPEGAPARHHDEAWIKTLFKPLEELDYRRLTFTTMNGHTSNGFYFIGRVSA